MVGCHGESVSPDGRTHKVSHFNVYFGGGGEGDRGMHCEICYDFFF